MGKGQAGEITRKSSEKWNRGMRDLGVESSPEVGSLVIKELMLATL